MQQHAYTVVILTSLLVRSPVETPDLAHAKYEAAITSSLQTSNLPLRATGYSQPLSAPCMHRLCADSSSVLSAALSRPPAKRCLQSPDPMRPHRAWKPGGHRPLSQRVIHSGGYIVPERGQTSQAFRYGCRRGPEVDR